MCCEVLWVCGVLTTFEPLLVETMRCSAVHLAQELCAGSCLWEITQFQSQLSVL